MLTRVTISGADDGVDPRELVALSREFPFVEWGILLSYKRSGEPRYPSLAWRARLYHEIGDGPVHLAAHFCGAMARELLNGSTVMLGALGDPYRRIQVNGWRGAMPSFHSVVWYESEREFILQVRSEELLQVAADEASAIKRDRPDTVVGGTVSALWDCSGGRGIESLSWPRAPLGLRLGYAGGINPDNVLDVIAAIGPVSHDYWIDMESGVRTEDRCDLGKARTVLERAAPFVEQP